MKLVNYIDPKRIFIGLEGSSKEEVIRNMIDKTAKGDKEFSRLKHKIHEEVMDRENTVSTAMGSGIMIPHARVEGYDDVVISIGILKKPLTCDIPAMRITDEVEVVILIVSEILKNKVMLKLMAGLSKVMMKSPIILDKMKSAKTSKEVFDALKDINIKIENRITADDVMDPSITPVNITDTLDTVAKKMIIEEKPGFPVIDNKNRFLGEITERELISFGMPEYINVMSDLSFLTVGEPFEEYLKNEKTTEITNIYRKDVPVVDRHAPIMDICFMMVKNGYTRIYVVENEKYFGTILRSNIIKKVLHI